MNEAVEAKNASTNASSNASQNGSMAAESGLGTIDTRREQMFPKLTTEEIDCIRRFGEVRRYVTGEIDRKSVV